MNGIHLEVCGQQEPACKKNKMLIAKIDTQNLGPAVRPRRGGYPTARVPVRCSNISSYGYLEINRGRNGTAKAYR